MPTKVLTAKIKSTRGFTMIELLVVLALLGAVSTIVVPQLWGQYQRHQERLLIEKFLSEMKDDVRRHSRNGLSSHYKKDDSYFEGLAEKHDLELISSTSFSIRADGFVQNGQIKLTKPAGGTDWLIEIKMPDGDVDIKPI